MDQNERTPDTGSGDEFEAEVSDLDPRPPRLIGAFWTAYTFAGRRLTGGQRLWRAGTAVGAVALVCVLLVVGTYASTLRHFFATQPARPFTLPAERDGMACVSDIAWSPDSRQIAVAGYEHLGCGADAYATPLILVYDALSGKLVRRIEPEATLLPALHRLLPNLSLPGDTARGDIELLIYQNFLLWSPDGRQLGLVFLAVAFPQTGWKSITGLFATNADGSEPRAYLHALDPAKTVSAREWDTQTGAMLDGTVPLGPYGTMPSAMAYTWDSGGHLSIAEPTPDSSIPFASSKSPVGNPTHDASFSVWQPGSVISVARWDTSGYSEGYEWSTRFAAWSPDGRYVVNLINVLAYLSLSEEASARVSVPQSAQGPQVILPVRDAALLALMWAAPPQAQTGEWEVAWRPDGRELAAFRLGGSTAESAGVYDCVSGRELASLPLATAPWNAFLAGLSPLLRWSPDGTHLLLFSPQLGAITLWGPKNLAAH